MRTPAVIAGVLVVPAPLGRRSTCIQQRHFEVLLRQVCEPATSPVPDRT
ncbi:hypothetical protein [Lentzea xinjiangensis]|nr:hypothetical protein [Lentzea xinjiangensis]